MEIGYFTKSNCLKKLDHIGIRRQIINLKIIFQVIKSYVIDFIHYSISSFT